MKTELQKQLEQAEIEKLRAIDRVKDLKAQIRETEKEPSIFKLMPIGSVWCGWKVVTHTKAFYESPIELVHITAKFKAWLRLKTLRELIAEQKKLDAMKRAADAALYYIDSPTFEHKHLMATCRDYRNIIEKEEK
jgi:hypothetical protein